MRVLVTRPREDAAAFAAELANNNHEALIEPLLEVEYLGAADSGLDLESAQALLFTSANGVRAFARIEESCDLPVYGVGDATAALARGAGFKEVYSASGDVLALAKLVTARLNPKGGTLLHVAAAKVAGDLQGLLQKSGFEIERHVLYRTEVRSAFSAQVCGFLTSGKIEAVTLFSPRTARTFANLVLAANLQGCLEDIFVVCLSQAVADQVAHLNWKGVRVAAEPNKEALMACLKILDREKNEKNRRRDDGRE